MTAPLAQNGTTSRPWGTSRMGYYTDTATVPAFTAVLDPETQTAVLVDEQGRTVEMGAHGTSTNTSTPTSTSGDGSDQGKGSDSDSVPSNDQD